MMYEDSSRVIGEHLLDQEDDSLMNRFPAIVSVVLPALLTIATGCASSTRSITTPSGLTYTVLREGSGPAARAGQHVLIHETTSFPDGRVFYTTRNGRPLRFLLGGGQVIDGLDEGVTGMRVGERRKMIVPPKLSRRSSYSEGLSPEDTLHYDVELVGIDP
jgi:FKBP-type peptidyl-prolyl cis-trans isomerase